MRILHVVPYYLPAWRYGGPIRSVHGLCKGLAGLGHDVHVFTTNIDGRGDSDVPLGAAVTIDGVKVWYFASRWLRRLHWSPSLGEALRKQVRSFDLLHLHTIYLWPTTAAARAARRAGVPYLLAPRGMLVPELIRRKNRSVKKAWIASFERRNLAHAAMVHFTSSIEAGEAEKLGIVCKQTCIIPNGIDLDEDAANDDTASAVDQALADRRFLLFIGRVNWEKGLDRLITALPRVHDCDLVIAGNDEGGYRRRLEAIARELGVHDRITFLGTVHGRGKSELLRRACALILPSYSENFGNVVLEAMAAGCPAIVTPEVGAAEIVRRTGGGVVLDGEPESMATGVNNLLAQPQILRQMGERAQAVVNAQFTWEAIARMTDRIYRRILAESSHAASTLDARVKIPSDS
jgi:glycosyltransferase involved in cell wall biosynthesis